MDHPTHSHRHGRQPIGRELDTRARLAARAADAAEADEAAADVAAAAEARRRLWERGIVPIEPDDRIGVMLGPEELVVAVRRAVSLERRKGRPDPDGGLDGDLYVTTQRLVYLGRVAIEYPLTDIREAFVAAGALRLVVGECRGVEIGVADPRLLRVEIAAVREAAHASEARDMAAPPVDAAPAPGPGHKGAPPDQGARR